MDKKFKVTVEGKEYEVKAPNADAAWEWANEAHAEKKALKAAPTVAKEKTAIERMTSASAGGSDATLPDMAKGVLGSAATVGNAIPGVPWLVDKIYGEEGVSKKSLEQFKEANKDTSGYKAGELAGDIAMTLAPGMGGYKVAKAIISKLPQARKAAQWIVPKVAELGGQSAAGGTAAYLTDHDVAEGAALGGALGVAGYGAGKLWDVGKKVFEPARQHASRYIHEAADATGTGIDYLLDALRSTRGMVPGEAPTAGRAAIGTEGGQSMPWLKTLEEGARGRTRAGQFIDIDRANERARREVLEPTEKMGQDIYDAETGTVMQSPLKQIREIETDPLYKAANPDMVYVSPRLSNMMDAPEAQLAAARGEGSYAQAGANARAAGEAAPPSAIPMREMGGPGGSFGSMGNQSTPAWTQLPMRSIDDLQRAKNYLTKEIDKLSAVSDSAGQLRLSQLKDARRLLTESMRKQSPNYDEASRKFAELSRPQNQSEVYHQLAAALRRPGGLPGERLGSFMTVRENAPQLLKKAGVPRFKFLEEVLTPRQMSDVNALTSSLRRESEYAALPNSKHALPEFLSPAEHIEQNAPPFLARWMTLTRHFLKKQAGKSDEQIAAIIDEAMTDPNRMADLIESLPPDIQRIATGKMGALGGSLVENSRSQGE